MSNFSIAELLQSNTATEYSYTEQFKPEREIIDNLQKLIDNILQPARDLLNEPITVNCGYRCERVNNKVGGVATSQHLKGQAADLNCFNNKILFDTIKNNLPFDQLIAESGNTKNQYLWIHVSYNEDNNRGQILYL